MNEIETDSVEQRTSEEAVRDRCDIGGIDCS